VHRAAKGLCQRFPLVVEIELSSVTVEIEQVAVVDVGKSGAVADNNYESSASQPSRESFIVWCPGDLLVLRRK
jgi:hypothetical protein